MNQHSRKGSVWPNLNLRKAFTPAFLLFFLISAFWAHAADVRVYTFDSQGLPIAGTFKVQKGPNFMGTFNSGDTAHLNAGEHYTIWAIFNNTSTERTDLLVSAGGDSLGFKTTNVKFHFSGDYLDFRSTNSWTSFGKTAGEWNARELFPYDYNGDTMRIQTGFYWNDPRTIEFSIFYGGLASVEKTLAVIRVLDNAGNPIQGATARGGYTTPTLWFVPGSTNANGLLIDIRDGEQTSLAYEAKVNGTVAMEGPKDPRADSYYLFQTGEVVLKLESCTGTPLAGGHARFGKDSVYTTQWFPNNPGTLTDSTGEVSGQMFAGTYSFEMQYKGTADQKIAVSIPSTGATITWHTVNVTLNYDGVISYGGATGDAAYFIQPSMELLPGTYKFNFRGASREDLTLSGCNYTKTAVIVDVLDCNGAHQSGVDVKWYKYGNANNKHAAGTTGATSFPVLLDSGLTNVGIVVDYLGQSNTLVQNISVHDTFTFQMIDVALELYNHDSTATLTPEDVQFYVYGQANNKMAFPSTLHKCLLPGLYGFVVKYNETSQNKNGIDVSVQNPVVFQTGLVDDLDGCTFNPTTYYPYGSAGSAFTFVDPMEFMPSNVGIRSSTNPTKLINVQAAGIHRLDTCANVALMDSCVSDSGWAKSTVITMSNLSGTWTGVSSLPDDSTYTDTAEVGQPHSYGGITVLPGTLPIKTGCNITYFRKRFGLSDTTGLEARFRMYMDDGTEIYINGHLIAREENMDPNNYKGVPHDLLLKSDHTYENGYLSGDQFDYVADLNLDTIVHGNMNTLVIVMRNPKKTGNIGGFSFRMDITKDGQSVLIKKKADANSNQDPNLLVAYPNPVRDILTIIPDQSGLGIEHELSVFNINGQMMIHKTITTTQDYYDIDLSNLHKGIYFVRLTHGTSMQYAKIIKE